MSEAIPKQVYKIINTLIYHPLETDIKWSTYSDKESFMNENNAFGQSIDDDGLPKYSPDRKNITAYHMYKLGMTDKLPDPEETHTPFFRTPSYYQEKAMREQMEAPEIPSMPDFQKPDKSDPFSLKPSLPDKPEEVQPPAVRPQSQNPDANGQTGASDGQSFGRRFMEQAFGSDIMPHPMPVPDNEPSNQAKPVPDEPKPVPARPETRLAPATLPQVTPPPVPEQKNVPGSGNDMAKPENVPPVMSVPPDQDMEGSDNHVARLFRNIAPPPPPENNLLSNESVRGNSLQTIPLIAKAEDFENLKTQNLLYTPDTPSRMTADNPDTSGDLSFGARLLNAISRANTPIDIDINATSDSGTTRNAAMQQTARPDENLSQTELAEQLDKLPAPSAGTSRRKSRPIYKEPVFTIDNPDNPRYQPLQVAAIPPSPFIIAKGRREVSMQMTNDINTDLTAQNKGYAIGINFTYLSQLEGGSNPKANVPMSNEEIIRARNRQKDIARNLTSNPQKALALQQEENRELNKSGVTIASGYDLGQTSIAEMRSYGLPESLIAKCAPYIGKKRLDALNAIIARPLILTDSEIDIVNRSVMSKKARECIFSWDHRVMKEERKTRPNAPLFHEMTSNQQTVVFSRYYHEGRGWADNRHNQPIYDAMMQNDWDAVNDRFTELIKDKQRPKDKKQEIPNHKYWPGWKADRFVEESRFLKEKFK